SLNTQKALKEEVVRCRGTRKLSIFISFDADDLAPLGDVAQEEKGNLRLLVLDRKLTQPRREFLGTVFRTVLAPTQTSHVLAIEDLAEVVSSPERDDLFIGVTVDPADEVVVLYRGNLERLAVPFSWFVRRNKPEKPDFNDVDLADHGQTLRFGAFEASSDAVLYDLNPEYRRRAKKRQLKVSTAFGACLQRLRLLRGLSRSDFAPVSAKEISRIERGEVERPRDETMQAITNRLKASPEEILSY
ncbi:MAG: helix-turn-helix domain-containing protein, partial [Longimicrobiales bacterium]